MKIIGLIGGMSWESSLTYYRLINESVKEKLGGLHSAQCILYSLDFADIEPLQRQGKWSEATQLLITAAQNLEKGGADFAVICTNTMHCVFDEVKSQIAIPMLHIADAAGEKVKSQGLRRIGLLGTKFTMEEDFYRERLIRNYGLEVLIPVEEERATVHDVIYNELCKGQIHRESRDRYITIIDNLVKKGAEGIILGCTEIGLLISKADSPVPLFDTAILHALAAVEYALA